MSSWKDHLTLLQELFSALVYVMVMVFKPGLSRGMKKERTQLEESFLKETRGKIYSAS